MAAPSRRRCLVSRPFHATPEQRRNWKIAGGGYGIHWPEIDEDISTEGLLVPHPGSGGVPDPGLERRETRGTRQAAAAGTNNPRCKPAAADCISFLPTSGFSSYPQPTLVSPLAAGLMVGGSS